MELCHRNGREKLDAHPTKPSHQGGTQKIRKTAKQTIKKLKQIHDDSTAKSIIEETITEADNDRKKRNETREKRKMEAAKASDNKKRKTTK